MYESNLPSPDDVLEFWFSETVKPKWFQSTPEFDHQLTERFAPLWKAARSGELKAWSESPLPALALVIVLDQFPLNMFRGKPESFSTEADSREVARQAIANGFHHRLSKEQKAFLYLPFMHSEALADQDYSVQLFEDAGLDDSAKWARHHRDIVRKFGRFPHRNAILGRSSSPEEREYLDSDEAFHG
jgi:uncharacterized protein (DUF924 family)